MESSDGVRAGGGEANWMCPCAHSRWSQLNNVLGAGGGHLPAMSVCV